MKLQMARNSLFAVLLRKPWWISILTALVMILAASAMMPANFAVYGISAGMPFLVIGIIAAWKQLQAPSPAHSAHVLNTLGAMSWRDFADAVEAAFRRDAYEVTRLAGTAADFQLRKAGGIVLVGCRRWKAASNGVEPLRELHAMAQAQDAQASVYITVGQLSDNARRFADEKKIRVIEGAGLVKLMQQVVPVKK